MKIKILSLLLIMCLSVGVMTSCSVKRYDLISGLFPSLTTKTTEK